MRLVAEAQEGGGDVFDIGGLRRTLQPGDVDAWEKGWLGLAETTAARVQFFFHANQYCRMSAVFLAGCRHDYRAHNLPFMLDWFEERP